MNREIENFGGNHYFESYGFKIYEYMVQECKRKHFVKQADIMREFGYNPDDATDDRDFRYYHSYLKEQYFAGKIEHCFTSNMYGLYIADGYLISNQKKKAAIKAWREYKAYKNSEDLKQQRQLKI
jgi:hypothetical protein